MELSKAKQFSKILFIHFAQNLKQDITLPQKKNAYKKNWL